MHSAHGFEMPVIACFIGTGELRLGVERLDDAHAEQRLFEHGNQLPQFLLAALGVTLQAFGPTADQHTRHGQQDKREQRQLPTQRQQRHQTHNQHQRCLQQRFQ